MQTLIHNKGNPHSQVWVLCERPYKQDEAKGFIFSDTFGYFFDKMMKTAGIRDYYVISRKPDPQDPLICRIVQNEMNHYKPAIIITLEEAGKVLSDKLQVKYSKAKGGSEEKLSAIAKYAGSLLTSKILSYPEHYILPTYAPDTVLKDYSLYDIITSIDLAKVKSELDWLKQHGSLKPLPQRILDINFNGPDGFARLLYIIENRFMNAKLISNDIETIYPKTGSIFLRKHPGYPVTIGLSDSVDYGISFNLFRDSIKETTRLWRVLDGLFKKVPQLGQNFHNFDQNYYEMLGFQFGHIPQDTMIRHHILWPELPHKLQFLTRQYTREPYYKDEGHGWSIKDMDNLKRYNCLDVTVTMEVFLEQEKEFDERPWLR